LEIDYSKLRGRTNIPKIVKYGLIEKAIELREKGLSYQKIADELNKELPEDDKIDLFAVKRFFDKLPELKQEVVQKDQSLIIRVVNKELDLIEEINELYYKAKSVLETMEREAMEKGRNIDPYRFKAVASEMRELLKQMVEIQKEINDYNNVRKFMEIVMSVLQKEVPDKIPIIIEELKIAKGTQWFANMMRKKVEDDD